MDLSKLTKAEIRYRHRNILAAVDSINLEQGVTAEKQRIVARPLSALANVELKARTWLIDPKGHVDLDMEFESKSFVANFLSGMYAYMFKSPLLSAGISPGNYPDGTNYGMKTRAGVIALYGQSGQNGAEGFGGAGNFGIIFGTGATATAPTQYDLVTPVTGGYGSGQLFHYGLMTIQTPTVVSNTTSFIMQRIVLNENATIVPLTEMGFALQSSLTTSNYHLMIRDTLPSTVNVAQYYAFVGQYTISVTT